MVGVMVVTATSFLMPACCGSEDCSIQCRDVTLSTKVCLVKAMQSHMDVSLTIEKTEHRRIDAFKLWCQRKLLRVTQTARGSNQSVLKEINPEYSLKGLMLKLKLQYFGCLMHRVNSLEKTLMLGKIEGRRRMDDRGRDGWMATLTQWT